MVNLIDACAFFIVHFHDSIMTLLYPLTLQRLFFFLVVFFISLQDDILEGICIPTFMSLVCFLSHIASSSFNYKIVRFFDTLFGAPLNVVIVPHIWLWPAF